MSSLPAKDPKIDRPILCFGTGRGGTTVFLRVLSEHPDLAWFSNYTHRFHHKLFFPLAFLSRMKDLPGIGEAMPYDWKIRPKPREANKLYRAMTGGAFTQPKPLGREDAREQMGIWRNAIKSHLRWHGKPTVYHVGWNGEGTNEVRAFFDDDWPENPYKEVGPWLAPGQMELYRVESDAPERL